MNTSLSAAHGRVELPGSMAGFAVVHDLYGERSIPVTDGGIQVSLNAGEGMILE